MLVLFLEIYVILIVDFFCAQRGPTVHLDGKRSKGFSLDQLHALPEELCKAIFESVSNRSGIRVLRDP